MDAQHPVGPVILQLFDEGSYPEELPPPAVQRGVFKECEVQMMPDRPVHLHEMVEMKPDPVV